MGSAEPGAALCRQCGCRYSALEEDEERGPCLSVPGLEVGQQCRCNPGGGLHNGAGAEFAASGSEGQTWCREGAKSPDGGKAGTGPEVSAVTAAPRAFSSLA